jgi:hypothetical protein
VQHSALQFAQRQTQSVSQRSSKHVSTREQNGDEEMIVTRGIHKHNKQHRQQRCCSVHVPKAWFAWKKAHESRKSIARSVYARNIEREWTIAARTATQLEVEEGVNSVMNSQRGRSRKH